MAVTDQQKLDFLLKKIGYTKTKTGSVVGTGAISGTPKQPFAEAIPSPLIIANGALWNEADSIPTTPPGADTTQVKVYLAATSGLRMTADATSSGQRAYIAYSTYNNTSSTRLTNWIDTQFGASYIIKVYKGDPNSGGVALSAAGSGANDGWFFDYSAGVLNFNDTNVPSGVTDTNIYIVGYRYIGQTGAPTSGISTFSYLDLTVERNLDVGVQGGISTFRNNIDLNADLDVDGHTNLDNLNVAGVTTFAGATTHSGGATVNTHLDVIGLTTLDDVNVSSGATFAGAIDANSNLDVAGIATLGSGSSGQAFLQYQGSTKLNTASWGVQLNGTLQVSDGDAIFTKTNSSSTSNSLRLRTTAGDRLTIQHLNDESYITAQVGNINLNAPVVSISTNFSVGGISTFTGNIDANGDLDVDGHTNLDNVSVAGVSTFTGDATFSGNVSIGGTLTYEDVTNVDSVGLLTARSGIRVTGGVIEAQAGENKIPSLYANMAALPSASTYHGMFAHVHATGRGYFAHGGAWYELVNADLTGRVGTGTESYFIDRLVSTSTTATSLNVVGVATFGGNVDVNGNVFDADGHVELDNVNIAGVTTFAGNIDANADLDVDGHTNLDNVSVAGVSTFSGNINLPDNVSAVFGTDDDGSIKHTGTNLQIFETTGNIQITNYANDKDVVISSDDGSGGTTPYFLADGSTGKANLYYYGSTKLATDITGVRFTGHAQPSANNAYDLGATSLNWRTVYAKTGDFSGDLDVDGHTNLDNVSVSGITTFSGIVDAVNTPASIRVAQDIQHKGDADTKISFPADDTITFDTSGSTRFGLSSSGNIELHGTQTGNNVATIYNGTGFLGFYASSNSGVNRDFRFFSSNSNSNESLRIASNGNVNVYKDLDVDGHTNLDNVSVAGVSTFSDNLRIVDNKSLLIGDLSNGDLSLVHDGNNSVIRNRTGNLYISNATQTGILVNGSTGAVNLSFGGDLKLETETEGVKITGRLRTTGDLDVDGHTNLDNVSVAGVTTFTGTAEFDGTAKFDSTITAGGSVGTNNQYLKSTGSGVAWASFPTARTSQAFTASAGQTTFSFSYTVGLVDVFVNGIKLSTSEFTATNGSSVVLAVGCFVGDIVEILSYNVATGGGGGGTLSNIVEDTTPQLGGNLDLFSKTINGTGGINITGVVTATQFKGDGSALTGIVASGSGVVVKDGGSTVGTAGTINFGDNLSVSAISAGIVTITGFSGITTTSGVVSIANDLDVDGHTNLDNVSIAGVVTATTFSGSGASLTGISNANISNSAAIAGSKINPNFGSQDIETTGNATISRLFIEAGVPSIYFTDTSDNPDYHIAINSGNFNIQDTTNSANRFRINASGNVSIANDLDVDGHTNLDNVSVAGVVTATTFVGAVQATSGTFSSNIDANGDLDVDGHTNLDNVSIAGVSTFASNVSVGDSITATGLIQASSGAAASNKGIKVGNSLTIEDAGNVRFAQTSGSSFYFNAVNHELRNVDHQRFIVAGSGVGNGVGLFHYSSGSSTEKFRVTSSGVTVYGTAVATGADINGDLDVDGHTNLDNVSVAGVTTFASNVSVGSSIAVGTGVTVESNGQATYTGIVTALKFVGDGSGLTNLPGGGSYGNNDVDNHLNVSGASSGQILSWNGSDYAWVADQTGGGSGISTISGVVNIANDLDVDGHTNLDNVSIAGVTTFSGTSNINTTGNEKLILSGSTSPYIQFQEGTTNKAYVQWSSGGNYLQLGNEEAGEVLRIGDGESGLIWRVGTSNRTVWTSGNDGASSGLDADLLDGQQGSYYSPNVGITTNLSGSFTASAGSPSTINTYGYGSGDIVVEYTVFIKNGSDFQSQKLLAMRDGTTIHSTQFAVMFSSSLLVQLDATISSGNILLRATPETGVSGSTTYKVKREVM